MHGYQTYIEKKLKQIISNNSLIYRTAGYILNAGGKRIRPLITLLSCEAVGGNFKNALDVGVAIEILHAFTLVHDDLMDNSDMRRGIPTVHKKWNPEIAILSGDLLAGLALKSLNKMRTPKLATVIDVFVKAFIDVCEGQGLDISFESKKAVTIRQYYKMIGKKTAALFAASAELGAIIGGGSQKQIEALRNYGYNLGIAFQIKDDLLDVIGDKQILGKPAGQDIVEGKKTYLLITGLEKARGENRKFLERISMQKDIKKSDISTAHQIFRKLGILKSTEAKIHTQINRAKRELIKIPINSASDMLCKIADKVVER